MRNGGVRKPNACVNKSVSRKLRTFHKISSQCLEQLKTKTTKKRSEHKMLWGFKAYQDWRQSRINGCEQLDIKIFDANLENLSTVTKENLKHSLSVFIAEVKKVNGDDFPGQTLYQLVVSIQHYLNEHNIC